MHDLAVERDYFVFLSLRLNILKMKYITVWELILSIKERYNTVTLIFY